MADVLKVVGDNIHVVGWGSVISFIGWAWRRSFQISQKEKAGEVAVVQLNKMATNDLPHMHEALTDLNGKHDESIKILTSIDKNIAILVDRSPRG